MLIDINPRAIRRFLHLRHQYLIEDKISTGLNPSRYKGKRFTGLIVPDEAIQTGREVEQCPHFRGTIQRFQEGLDWNQTEYKHLYETWYITMANGKYQHKTFEDFYAHRLKSWDAIFDDIKTNGYKITKPRRDNIEIALNDLGKPLLIDGRHRLAIAQILNIKKIPATVNILAESLAKQDLNKLANSRPDENLIKALADHRHRLTKQLRNKDIKSRLATAIRSAYPKNHSTAKQHG